MTLTTTLNNRYQLLELIGRGGMGEVYVARDRLNRQQIAVKLVAVPDELQHYDSSLGDELNPFLALAKEFELLASLKHPHIINVLDYGFAGPNHPYFTMDYLPGAKTIVEHGNLLPFPEKIQLFVNMLQALSYVHQRGIVHRDLKPSNVLVDSAGGVKVLDFGLSTLQSPDMTDYGDFIGTLPYMAPEVLDGKLATMSSDLYAVGTLAYELFQGHYPFDYGSLDDLILAIQSQTPEFSDQLPINQVISTLMAKEPVDRFTSAFNALDAIEQITDLNIDIETLEVRRSLLTAARFVGRDAELRQLETLVEATLDRHRNAIIIGGESGVGKSRLVDELRTRALVVGATVLTGQAIREQQDSFILWQPILRHLLLSVEVSDYEAGILKIIVPDIEVILERPVQIINDIRRVPDTLVQIISRCSDPLVLILEDLQWQTDLSLVERLAGKASQTLFLIGTYRNDERPDLPESLPAMQTMSLERLDEQDMALLSSAMLGDAGTHPDVLALLQRETAGNVFFVVETLNALAEHSGQLKQIGRSKLPESVAAKSVQQILVDRIQRVPDRYYDVLKFAAVAGRQIDLTVVDSLQTGVDIDEWLYLCTNYAILENWNQQWRFTHDRIREVLLDQLTDYEKPGLHEQVAVAVETLYPDDESVAAQLVEHWHQARKPQREAYQALLAGRFSNRLGNMYDAQRFVTRGLHLISEDDNPGMFGQFVQLQGDIAFHYSHYDEARAYHEQAMTIARKIQDKGLEANALTGLGNIALYRDRPSEAEEYYYQALKITEDKIKSARLLANLGIAMRVKRDFQRSRQLLQDSLILFQEMNNHFQIAKTLVNLSSTVLAQGNENPIPYLEEARDIYRELGSLSGAATVLINLGNYSNKIGDWSSALGYLEDCIEIEAARQSPYLMRVALENILTTTIHTGNLDLAEQYLEQLQVASQQTSSPSSVARYYFCRGDYYFYQQRLDTAKQSYLEALEIQNNINDTLVKFETYGMLSAIAIVEGDYKMAHKYQQVEGELANNIGLSEAHAIMYNHQGDLALAESRFTDAYQAYRQALNEAVKSQFSWMTGHALLGFGKILHVQGHLAMAIQTLHYLIQHVPCSYWTIKEAKELLEKMRHKEQIQDSEISDLDILMQKIAENVSPESES